MGKGTVQINSGTYTLTTKEQRIPFSFTTPTTITFSSQSA
jgi:hypothetical protein